MKLVEKLNIKKNLHFKLEDIYFCILIILIFITDRFFKIKIITKFSDNTFFVNNFINLDLIWNTGIGFGILTSDSIIVYNLITIFIALVILYLIYIAINSDRFDKFVFSIIIGGALGNFYDRLFFKAVPDFIDFHFKDLHWFTFNIADIFISFGVLIFLTKGLFIKNEK
jgi:signal peptidase II